MTTRQRYLLACGFAGALLIAGLMLHGVAVVGLHAAGPGQLTQARGPLLHAVLSLVLIAGGVVMGAFLALLAYRRRTTDQRPKPGGRPTSRRA